jgi:N-acetylmuramoyl-L-alanine amidase
VPEMKIEFRVSNFLNNPFRSFIVLLLIFLISISFVPSVFAYSMVQPPRLLDHRISIGGVEYFPLKKVADKEGFSIEWDGLFQKATLYKDGKYLSFIVGEPFYLLDDQVSALKYPARIDRGNVVIPKELAFRSWWKRQAQPKTRRTIIPRLPFQKGQFTISKIVLDPGHGGKDQGARAYGLREKDINLKVAKKIRDKLRANGINALMTRETDRFVSLQQRAQMANRSNTDLFISVHANASPSRTPDGFEVFYLSEALDDGARAVQILENSSLQYEENFIFPNKNSKDPTVWDLVLTENRKESAELARLISKNIQYSRLTPSRGVKTAQFHVLKWTDKPSILLELGFLTNYREAKKLGDSKYQDRMATQITKGILEYKELYERTNGFTR